MGLVNPVAVCDHEYEASKQVTAPLVDSIITQESTFTADPTANNPAKAAVMMSSIKNGGENAVAT